MMVFECELYFGCMIIDMVFVVGFDMFGVWLIWWLMMVVNGDIEIVNVV